MDFKEFEQSIELDSIVVIEDKEFEIEEIVDLETDDDLKLKLVFLHDESVLFVNYREEDFVFYSPVDLSEYEDESFTKVIEYEGEQFLFENIVYAVVTHVESGGLYNEGDNEEIYEYISSSDDNNRMMICKDPDLEEKLDFIGRVVPSHSLSVISVDE